MSKVIEKENIKIEDMIHEIRGKQVMLDSDLAKLYQCANGTKDINKAVKRNIERFPDDFYFELTKVETENLWFQIGTANKMSRAKPHVFTEQGIAMLATVLRTDIASSISINIMRAFVAMRHYISNNEYRISNIETKIIEHDKLLKTVFDKFEKKPVNELYQECSEYDAYSRIVDIFNEAKEELIIVDNYADKTILDMIRKIKAKVILITKDSDRLSNLDIEKYNLEYKNLKVIRNNYFHDRYFILDQNIVYHSGASINNAGNKTFNINLITDEFMKQNLIDKIKNLG